MIKKFIYILMLSVILIACNNIQKVNQVDYCKSELNAFSKKFSNNIDVDIDIYSELSDGNIDMQSIRVYMKANPKEGRDVTIGWLKIDKNNNKIYDNTDNENVVLDEFSERRVRSFVHHCIN